MTNGDKIRQMTDDELAFALTCPHQFEEDWPMEGCYQPEHNCQACTKQWLQQEAE